MNTKKNLIEKVLIFIQSYGFVKIALVGTGTETKIFAVATHTQCHTRYEVFFFVTNQTCTKTQSAGKML